MGRIMKLHELMEILVEGHDNTVSDSMFTSDDILDCRYIDGEIIVKFRGLNGSIPYRYFTTEAKKTINKWYKKNNTRLGKVINQ